MRSYVILDGARVVGSGATAAEDLSGVVTALGVAGLQVVDVDVAPENPGAFYWSDGALQAMPERPSDGHDFDYDTKQWVLNEANAWAAVRRKRAALLAATDWVTLRAQDQGTAVPQEWLDYRQALRDVTEQTDPLNITWPQAPA